MPHNMEGGLSPLSFLPQARYFILDIYRALRQNTRQEVMMSKKRNRSSTFRKRRDTNDIANRRLPLPSNIRPSQLDLVDFLRTIEDRREYHPDGHHFNAASFNRRTHRLVLPETTHHPVSSRNTQKIPSTVAFAQPDKVLVCVRRKRREEVLHALQKTGKRGQRSPRRNYFSDITC